MSTANVVLLTGLPGNGKTLHAICMVKEMAAKSHASVFYSGIEILDNEALPWQPIDPKRWFDAPPNSIVVIDECWKTFPVRTNGSAVPDHVERVATVRHGGIILVIITQHPSQVDLFVRRLVGRHLHHVRRLGFQACAVYEWPKVVDNCDKTRKDAEKTEWGYNKAAYAWYKSAEVHTVKSRIPRRLLILVIAPVLLGVAVWYLVHIFLNQRAGTRVNEATGVSSSAAPANSGPAASMPVGPMAYLSMYRPRVPGLEYTAPVYDKVTLPVRAPYPAACVLSATRCECYSQQATKLEVPKQTCIAIAQGGFFMAWQEDKHEVKAGDRAPAAQAEPVAVSGGGLGGFNTTRFASAEPVSVTAPAQQDQQGRGRAIAR